MKKLVLELVGVEVSGLILVRHWGGGEGVIQLESTYYPLDSIEDIEFNDTWFWVESVIKGHDIDVELFYSDGDTSAHKYLLSCQDCTEQDVINVIKEALKEVLN